MKLIIKLEGGEDEVLAALLAEPMKFGQRIELHREGCRVGEIPHPAFCTCEPTVIPGPTGLA